MALEFEIADGAAAEVAVTEEAGLVQVLEEEKAPGDEDLRPMLQTFLATTGLEGTPSDENLDRIRSDQAEGTSESLGDLWESIKAWFREEEHEVVETEERPIELAAYWLTLPKDADAKVVDGATVTMSSSHSSSKEASASLSIAGIGGGPSFTISIKEAVSFKTEADERASLLVNATFEKVKVKVHGKEVRTYARLKSIDKDKITWRRRPHDPPSGPELGSKKKSEAFEFADAGGPSTKLISVDKNTTWELGSELKVFGAGVKLGAKVTYEQEVEYAYTLPGGHDYKADRYSEFPALIWEKP